MPSRPLPRQQNLLAVCIRVTATKGATILPHCVPPAWNWPPMSSATRTVILITFIVYSIALLVVGFYSKRRMDKTALDETSVQVNDGVAEIDKVGILLEKLVVKKDDTTLTADVDYIASFIDEHLRHHAMALGRL